jgi:hypothetical protein
MNRVLRQPPEPAGHRLTQGRAYCSASRTIRLTHRLPWAVTAARPTNFQTTFERTRAPSTSAPGISGSHTVMMR